MKTIRGGLMDRVFAFIVGCGMLDVLCHVMAIPRLVNVPFLIAFTLLSVKYITVPIIDEAISLPRLEQDKPCPT